jgi:hypothetical protein
MGATIALAQPTLPVEPGQAATLEVTVQNNGTVVDQFTFEIVGDAGTWATAEPPTLSLFPGAQEKTRITFRPPREPSTTAGIVRFGVMARSREDPAGSTVEEGALDVASFLAPSAELIPRTSHGSRRARHELAIDNRGNVPMDAALEGLDADRLLRFELDPPNVSVPPGVAGFANVGVKPVRAFWRGPAKSRPFQLAVRTGGPDAEPLLLDGNFLQESILPWWFLRALLLLAGLLIALLLLWVLFLKPQITSRAAEALVDFGFSPKPGSAAGGGGNGGNGGPGGSPTPGASGLVTVTPAPSGLTEVDGRLDKTQNSLSPTSGTLSITDLIFSNPTGAGGEVTLQRITPTGTSSLFVLKLENFRDLDFHFVTPITVRAGESLVLVPNSTAAVGPVAPACEPAVFYSGYVQGP